MEPKFKPGDLVRVRSTNDQVIVIEYKISKAGNVFNYLTKTTDYPENAITDEILCEGTIAGKFQRKYIKEINLELSLPPQ